MTKIPRGQASGWDAIWRWGRTSKQARPRNCKWAQHIQGRRVAHESKGDVAQTPSDIVEVTSIEPGQVRNRNGSSVVENASNEKAGTIRQDVEYVGCHSTAIRREWRTDREKLRSIPA